MRDPIFKGATRPVMWLGVPQLVFLALLMFTVLGGMWGFVLIGPFVGFVVLVASAFIYVVLRHVSSDDPHRLLQRFMQMQSFIYGRRNRMYWGTHSAGPTMHNLPGHAED